MIASWLSLLLVPSLSLANLSITYALVTPACARQSSLALHLTTLVCLVASLGITGSAWRGWQALISVGGDESAGMDSDAGDAPTRKRFVAAAAAIVGALFCLVTAAQWIGQWVLSPCFA